MKIQHRLMVSILPIVLVAVSLVTIISSVITVDYLQNLIRDNAQLLSRTYSTQLETKVGQVLQAVEDLSSATVTSIHIETTLIDTQRRYPEFSRVFYTSTGGSVVDMAPYTPELMHESFADMPGWQDAYRNGNTAISPPNKYYDEPSILIFTPVRQTYVTNPRADVVGVLCIVVPLESLFTNFRDVSVGATGYLAVVDGEGTFIEHPNDEFVFARHVSEMPAESPLTDIETAMVRQATGFATYYDGMRKNYISFSPVPSSGWSLAVFGDYQEIAQSSSSAVLIFIVCLVFSITLAAVVLYFIVHTIVRPLELMTDAVQAIGFENRKFDLVLTTSSEVGILYRALKEMVEKIHNHQSLLEQAVREKTAQLRQANEDLTAVNEEYIASNAELERTRNALWSEMELAHKLQTVLLPERPHIEGFDIAAFMRTTDQVGGDYYDVVHVDGMDWFVIGDVSGHGVTAGLIMMMVQTSIHIALNQNPEIEPDELLTLLNKIIHENIHRLGEQKYMTLTVFAVHSHGKLSFSGAHLPLIIYRKKTHAIEFRQTTGVWIGLVRDIHGKNTVSSFNLERGDTLLLYTDGITESVRKTGENYTQDDLAALFLGHAELQTREIRDAIRNQLENLELDDDVTIFILKRTGDPEYEDT